MKVLVLGATGFVGSYLVERAMATGHEVVGTHCNPTIHSGDWSGYEERLVRCDIRYREQVDQVIAASRPDVVYLLAAQSYPALSWRVPIETLDTNVLGTANVFESIKAARIDPGLMRFPAFALCWRAPQPFFPHECGPGRVGTRRGRP